MIDYGIVPEYPGKGRRHVLVVEKDTLQGHLLKVSLQDLGWVVRLADDPQEALLFCEHDFFDVAIVNCNYPGNMDGFVLAEQLREQYHLPSLMITASRYTDLRKIPAFRVDQDLLFKPYRLMELRPRLQRLMAGVPKLCEHRLGAGV